MGPPLGCHFRQRRRAAGRQFKQGFGRLTGQVVGQFQQRILVGSLHIGQPPLRHAIGQQLGVTIFREQFRLLPRGRPAVLDVLRNEDLLDTLADLDKLRCAGGRVHFQLAPLGPLIGLVVVIDIAEQQTASGLVDDQTNVTADTHRPEVRVFGSVELVEAHAVASRVNLQVERGGLGGLLLVARQARQAGGEGVSDAEFHALPLRDYQLAQPITKLAKTVRSIVFDIHVRRDPLCPFMLDLTRKRPACLAYCC